MHEFKTSRKVEFADTDMAGIMHFARFGIFMETAEHEFLEAIGAPIHQRFDGREIGWPRIKMSLEFKRPARFRDVVEISLRVLRKGRSSMTYGFLFSRDGEELARGEVKTACCVIREGGGLEPIPIPDLIADAIQEVDEADQRW